MRCVPGSVERDGSEHAAVMKSRAMPVSCFFNEPPSYMGATGVQPPAKSAFSRKRTIRKVEEKKPKLEARFRMLRGQPRVRLHNQPSAAADGHSKDVFHPPPCLPALA